MMVFPSIAQVWISGFVEDGLVMYINATILDIESSYVSPPDVKVMEILLAVLSDVSNPCKVR
jgi:hypothetical protein